MFRKSENQFKKFCLFAFLVLPHAKEFRALLVNDDRIVNKIICDSKIYYEPTQPKIVILGGSNKLRA